MAYVLGFFTADGNMIRNKRGAHFIEFTSTDKVIIYEIRKALGSNLTVSEYNAKNKDYKTRYRLQIGSKEIFKDLLKLGLTPKKSKTIKLPPVPNKYLPHFLRGYFDGDGCVNVCTYKRRNRKSLSTIINSSFTSGSKRILLEIKNQLSKLGILKGGTLYFHSNAHRLRYSIMDTFRLYEFMYGNLKNNLFLERKKIKFEKYFARR